MILVSLDAREYHVASRRNAAARAQRRRDAQADLRTVVTDLLSGRYRHPLRVVAFNTAEGWARDVSADIARQVLNCARELEHELPAAVRDFVERAGA